MQVSIIITSHNYGGYLRDAIDSALNQNWPDVEVIVVDDGSQDNSADIIDSYTGQITALYKRNGGQCSAVNAGVAESHGDVVILLDADDYLLPNAAELHVRCMQKPDVVKSCGYLDVIDTDGHLLGRRLPDRFGKSGNYLEATLNYGLDIYGLSFTSGHAWSRSFLEQVLPLPEMDLIGPDGYLTAIDRLFGSIEFIPAPVGCYRRHGKNKGPMTQQFTRAFLQERIKSKDLRIEFAIAWAMKLGYPVDEKKLGKIRDWRIFLMRHLLSLMERRKSPIGFTELVFAPFQRFNASRYGSVLLAGGLLLIRFLPRELALPVSRRMLLRHHT
ncbi:MAG: glycosyltransferase [Gammaproteobacteria bacterium]|nr:glycosyltransferase [Gammaproteobacteria bacterium]MCP4089849.1 glycosyltransferase [Gammaproteobacteria bacterium]MCP4275504.1 glycosyltransferase [Gammaproteobacteria bacterium]MCP4832996.1 glycosyltransferase [Gammaproteobacteria bacterium]MCP4928632.1 glycosyltransferase [Gammaproteobacteria bacterium]